MKRKSLKKNRSGTAFSGIVWSLFAILILVAGIPVAIGGVSNLQDTEVKQSFHNPTEISEFNRAGVGVGTSDYHLDTNASIYYDYGGNSTHEGLFPSGPYDELDYNEFLADGDSSLSGFNRLQIQADLGTEDLLSEDMTALSMTAEYPTNGSVNVNILAVGTDGSTDYSHTIYSDTHNVSGDMERYEYDTEFLDIMVADSEMSDADDTAIVFEITPDTGSEELITPGDVFRFDMEYQTHTSRVASIWSIDLITIAAGVFTIVAAIFSTPYVDLRDITERFWGDN